MISLEGSPYRNDKSFFIALDHVPTSTAQEKQYSGYVDKEGNARTRVYLTEGAKLAKRDLEEGRWKVINAKGWDESYKIPAGCPVRLSTLWCFEIPKGKKGKKDAEKGNVRDGDWKVTKPDTDNLVKQLKDLMTKAGCFWDDDAQVCHEIIFKCYTDSHPGILVEITQLMNDSEE